MSNLGRRRWVGAMALMALATAMSPAHADATAPAKLTVDQNGTVNTPPLSIPFSNFASPEAKKAFLDWVDVKAVWIAEKSESINDAAGIAKERNKLAAYYQPFLDKAIAAYPVTIENTKIAGVTADVVIPKGGVSAKNKDRVLIDLHSGGFFTGGGILGRLEATPVAGLGKIKVIALDYRQGPEYKFPAASEDVAAVYRELLRTYKPENIGIYGCSAGGLLTAESIAWFQKEKLPRPGAIGLMCSGANGWRDGDSATVSLVMDSTTPPAPTPKGAVNDVRYFSDADVKDPMVAPVWTPAILAKFPPTLLITGTRDMAMSSVIYTHTQLVKQDVDAELHVWEGMNHDFFADVGIPESKEAIAVIVKFFDRHLGHR